MSYRKITVDDKQYEYVIGKKFLKVKGLGIFDVSLFGNKIISLKDTYRVTPAIVARVIRGDLTPTVFHCDNHGVETTELVYAPYDQEIYGKFHHMMNCPECVYQNEMDI